MTYLINCLIIALTLSLLLSCETPQASDEAETDPTYQALADSIKQQFAPDKRVATFDVKAIRKAEGVVLRGESNLPAAKTKLLRELEAQGLEYTDSIVLLPTADLGEKTYGLVRQSVANLRTKPGHSEELTTQALLGTPLKVLKKQGSWYRVQIPDGYIAWLDSGGFERIDSRRLAAWQQSKRVAITAEYELVYATPDADAAVIGDLVAGDILELDEAIGEYYLIHYPDGKEGYIRQASAIPLESWLAGHSLTTEAIFKTARKYIGRPYLWGGTSGKGMDCSGFTKTVYFRHGLIIPRDASQQVHVGTDLVTDTDMENFQPGDFLFFGTYRDDGSKRITHVGIYLGEGRFIHSGADNGAVAIQSLRPADPDYAAERLQTLIAARRPLDGQRVGAGIQSIAQSEWYMGNSVD